MEVSELARNICIIGVLRFAVPFPIALLASAVAWAVAGFIAVESLFGLGEEPAGDRGSPSRPGD